MAALTSFLSFGTLGFPNLERRNRSLCRPQAGINGGLSIPATSASSFRDDGTYWQGNVRVSVRTRRSLSRGASPCLFLYPKPNLERWHMARNPFPFCAEVA